MIRFLMVWLLMFGLSVGSYAKDGDEVNFRLNSIKLLKNTWGGGNANLKILIIHENGSGEKSELKVVDNKIASVRETISLRQNASIGIPVYGRNDINVEVIILNENENAFLASLVVKAIRNIARRKGVKQISRFSKRSWYTLVAKEVFSFGVDYGVDKLIQYLKENEILKTRFDMSTQNLKRTETRGNVRISYETRFSGQNNTNFGYTSNTNSDNDREYSTQYGGNSSYKYAFYGQIGKKKNFWINRKATKPIVGDILIARTDINIRAYYIRETNNGWKNARVIGKLHDGDKIKVIEVKEVFNNYFWVKFK